MKRFAIVGIVVAALFALPAFSAAAGLAGATVKVVNPADATEFGSAVTDAEGAFAFVDVPAGAWRLDVTTADLAGTAQLLFAVAAEKEPARVAGRVTALDGQDISLQVNAAVGANDASGIVLDEGYPRLQPAWNLNWRHAMGKTAVRLSGSGLDTLEKVVLSSATGSIESTRIVKDPETGIVAALFPKKAAFEALVPADAVRGDTVALGVALTTATETASFDATIRIVGRMRPRR